MAEDVDYSILPEDLDRIRGALTAWKGADLAQAFWGDRVADYAEAWSQFVETDWSEWDPSEYDHDLGCRYWLQVFIEHSAPSTRSRLERAIQSTDAAFQTRMRPAARVPASRVPVLHEHPYFWETHTLHPELARS